MRSITIQYVPWTVTVHTSLPFVLWGVVWVFIAVVLYFFRCLNSIKLNTRFPGNYNLPLLRRFWIFSFHSWPWYLSFQSNEPWSCTDKRECSWLKVFEAISLLESNIDALLLGSVKVVLSEGGDDLFISDRRALLFQSGGEGAESSLWLSEDEKPCSSDSSVAVCCTHFLYSQDSVPKD